MTNSTNINPLKKENVDLANDTKEQGSIRKDLWNYLLKIRLAASSITGIVASGEALTAVYFMQITGLGSILAVALPTFTVSYLLFYSETFNLLNALVSNQLFKDHQRDANGEKTKDKDGHYQETDFIGWKRNFLLSAILLSGFAGSLCGFLTFNSIFTTIGSIFYGLSFAAAIASPPFGLLLIATTFAMVSFIANSALLYAGIENFIRERKYQDYINTFNSIFGIKNKGAKKYNNAEKIYHGLFWVLALTAGSGILAVSFGVLQSQVFKALNGVFRVSATWSSRLAATLTTIGVSNSIFYAISITDFIKVLEEQVKTIIISIYNFNFFKIFNRQSAALNSSEQKICFNDVRHDLLLMPVTTAAFVVLLYCCYLNGVAQGSGAKSDPRSTVFFTKCLQLSQRLAKSLSYILMTTASTAANAFACLSSIFDMMNMFGSTSESRTTAGAYVTQRASAIATQSTTAVKSVVGYGFSIFCSNDNVAPKRTPYGLDDPNSTELRRIPSSTSSVRSKL